MEDLEMMCRKGKIEGFEGLMRNGISAELFLF